MIKNQHYAVASKLQIMSDIHIRPATPKDADAIWDILRAIIAKGDSFAFAPDTPRETMLGWWMGRDKHGYVAEVEGQVLGTFVLKDNQPGLGAHIANAAYATSPDAGGKGIGYEMGAWSITEARRLGYRAMQFNIVVKSNERAVKLWQRLGFEIIGEIPEAFNHLEMGLTNAYIMYQKIV